MTMIKLFPVSEIPANSRKVVDVGSQKVLVIHSEDKFYAVDNHCPHMNLPLQGGKINDTHILVCPFHRSAFDLENGDVKEWTPWPPVVGKALGALAHEKKLPLYKTEIIDGVLWVADQPTTAV